MAKQKWYQNKGGWIGAISLFLVGAYTLKDFSLIPGFGTRHTLTEEIQLLLTTNFIAGIILFSVGFLIGSLIYNKFFKKRR